jgi:hypothetical protein
MIKMVYTMIKTILFLSLVLFSLLTSCSVYDNYYNNNEYGPSYRSGDEGVVVSFLNDAFTFYDGEYMQLDILVQNKGTYDTPSGKIVLSGFDPTIVKLRDDEITLPDEFYGKSAYNDEGSLYFLSVEEDSPLSLSLSDTYDATLQASVCYSYQTIATEPVCLLYDPQDDFICQQDTLHLDDQGAPVAVTEIEQTYLRDQVRFTVTIKHVGDGTVLNAYDTDAYEACPFTLDRDDIGYVYVAMEIKGLGEPSCVPASQYVRLNNDGEGLILCTFTLREQKSFQTPLQITVDYLYLDTAEQTITVVERQSSLGTETDLFDTNIGSTSSDSSSGSAGDECYCSDANMKKWGGCICLYLDGQMYYCLEGSNEIKVSGDAGNTVEYEVRGSSTVNKCGNTASPNTNCPFTAYTTLGPMLSIYGMTTDGQPVSERCDLKPSKT